MLLRRSLSGDRGSRLPKSTRMNYTLHAIRRRLPDSPDERRGHYTTGYGGDDDALGLLRVSTDKVNEHDYPD